ncbi:YggT family protein [Aerococcus kribbianus]|uniref:YggT family protein n=1 Tax=Aerococcus kribbianus TaxID=2999064 RepID=A0A9X3FQH4_9LACT|nr:MULTISPECIES: YggT family protein [unclassified Aerococcus]MCZ0717706.1 YggT family protein [Aerococcus sp. YH-aer221]MCZ0725994.1 YggT family protein [Aerococcus sp. YH-aer222]
MKGRITIYSIVGLLQRLIYYYTLVLVVYALMSWFPQARESKLGQIVARLAEPYLSIFDAIIPSIGGVSFNVIIGILVLNLASRGLLVFL